MKKLNHSNVERLESRIAPASLVNPKTVTFVDADGDDVTVHISKPLFTADNFEQALSFASSDTPLPGGISGERLLRFDVKQLGLAAQGLDIAITAERSALHGGDGHVNIGAVDAFDSGNAASVDLGRVRVDGDLNFIDAGDAVLSTPGLKSLKAESIGVSILYWG